MGTFASPEKGYRHLPYGKTLQLLDDISHCDQTTICALAHHWRNAATLLSGATEGSPSIRAIALLEFAAQAMALHGISQGDTNAAAKQVSVLSVKKLRACAQVPESTAPLEVKAELMTQLEGSAQYRFQVGLDDNELLAGELLVLARTP